MTNITNKLGLYIHIPFCEKKCPYCAFYSEPIADADPNALIDAIFTELDRYSITEPVETIYIGGGSPSCLPRELLVETIISLVSRFNELSECTIECNPAQADAGLLKLFRTLGVNRLSLGAQSFDPTELKTLGRIHSPEHIARAVQTAKDAGFDNIGLDLIFGIPGSTVETWQYSLDSAIELQAQHISAYSLTIEKNTPFARAVTEGALSPVDEQTDRAMYETARQRLTDAGFAQYEISNFARPGFECQHNIRYWKNQPVIGLGPAAAGWYEGSRTTNTANIEKYMTQIKNGKPAFAERDTPSPEQIASETAVLGLRMTEGIDLSDYHKQTGFELRGLFGNAMKQHCSHGLLQCGDHYCRLTKKGYSYADTVAQDFVL